MATSTSLDFAAEDAAYALQVAEAVAAIYDDAESALLQALAEHLWRAATQVARAPTRKKRLEQISGNAARRGVAARRRKELLAELGALAASGPDEEMVREYLQRRLAEAASLRREANRIVARLERRVFPVITQALTEARMRGERRLELELAEIEAERGRQAGAKPADLGPEERRAARRAAGDLARLGRSKGLTAGQGVLEIARQMVKNLRVRHYSALRTIDDEFQMVNRTVVGRAIAGAETITQAVERELELYARKGITEFVDRGGKSWDLTTYAAMTVRTSVIRANTDGHLAALAADGHRFVICTVDAFTCQRCAPWEGEILALGDGPTGAVQVTHYLSGEPMTIEVRGSVQQARRTGLQHPNCGHALGLYTPGVTQRPTRPATDATYADSQAQRRLERQVRAAKRAAALARTPGAQREARQRSKHLQAELEELASRTGLRRRRERERSAPIPAEKVEAARQSRIVAGRALRQMRQSAARAAAQHQAATPGRQERQPRRTRRAASTPANQLGDAAPTSSSPQTTPAATREAGTSGARLAGEQARQPGRRIQMGELTEQLARARQEEAEARRMLAASTTDAERAAITTGFLHPARRQQREAEAAIARRRAIAGAHATPSEPGAQQERERRRAENAELERLQAVHKAAAQARQAAERRLEQAQQEAEFTRRYRPGEAARAERELVRARSAHRQASDAYEAASTALTDHRDALHTRRRSDQRSARQVNSHAEHDRAEQAEADKADEGRRDRADNARDDDSKRD